MVLSNFAERLNELIFDTDKSISTISEELGCGVSTIEHYLAGRYLPTVDMAVRLADYFNCTTDYLLGIADENYATTFKCCPPFGEQIIALCKHYKISRYRLQQLTEISESTMRFWVRGKTKPKIETVVKIADKLKCSVDFVLGRET